MRELGSLAVLAEVNFFFMSGRLPVFFPLWVIFAGKQILPSKLKQFWIVSEVTKATVAMVAKQSSDCAR